MGTRGSSATPDSLRMHKMSPDLSGWDSNTGHQLLLEASYLLICFSSVSVPRSPETTQPSARSEHIVARKKKAISLVDEVHRFWSRFVALPHRLLYARHCFCDGYGLETRRKCSRENPIQGRSINICNRDFNKGNECLFRNERQHKGRRSPKEYSCTPPFSAPCAPTQRLAAAWPTSTFYS